MPGSAPAQEAPPEEEIVRGAMLRLSQGDKSAFDVVFASVWPPICRYTAHLLGAGATAEDVAQRAVIRLFEDAPRYRPGSSVVAWALSLAYWEARTERKRIQRAKTEALESHPRDLAPGALDQMLDEEARREFQALLSSLSPEELGLLGLGSSDVLAGLQPSTVRKRRQRLLERLRQVVSDLGWGGKEPDETA